MFGMIKENILNELEVIHAKGDQKKFKKNFLAFFKTLKENKSLKEFYEIYDLFNKVSFDDTDVAKEFVEESVKYLRSFNKNEIKNLKKLTENIKELNKNSVEYKLDQLIFNEKLSIKDKATIKIDLAKKITNRNSNTNYLDGFEKLNQRINENFSKLNENEKNILELFIENDSNKINSFYQNLIKETENIVEKNIIEANNLDVVKKLVEVKKRLNELKEETPSINEIERISELKNSFN